MHDISPVAENMASYTTIELCIVTFHVCIVDIIMFIKRFVVFSTLYFWHEFVLCVSRAGLWLVQSWVMVGTQLGDGWCNVG